MPTARRLSGICPCFCNENSLLESCVAYILGIRRSYKVYYTDCKDSTCGGKGRVGRKESLKSD